MKIKILSTILTAALVASAAGAQQLNGAGATFPNPIYSKWFSEYAASQGQPVLVICHSTL